MDYSPPSSSLHGILQARTLEWVAVPASRGSSWPKKWMCNSCIAGRLFTAWAMSVAYICTYIAHWFHFPGEPGLNVLILQTKIWRLKDFQSLNLKSSSREVAKWNPCLFGVQVQVSYTPCGFWGWGISVGLWMRWVMRVQDQILSSFKSFHGFIFAWLFIFKM